MTINTLPTTATVTFSNSILLTSLQPGTLQLDGNRCTSFVVNSDRSVTFTLPPGTLGQGIHTLSLAASAVVSIQGGPLIVYTTTLVLDSVSPRVIGSSLQEGGTTTPGSLTYTVTFSEPMRVSDLSALIVTLKGLLQNIAYTPVSQSYSPDGTVLTLVYMNLPEDRYTLTLLSGAGKFEDAAGNALDGEPAWPMPPNRSGDGIAGGNFFVDFRLDSPDCAFPALQPQLPAGSGIGDGTVASAISSANDSDSRTINLSAGQTLSIDIHPASAAFRPIVSIYDQSNYLLAATSAPASGADALLQTVPITASGLFTVVVSGASATVGLYTEELTVDAALDSNAHNGPPNTSPAGAES